MRAALVTLSALFVMGCGGPLGTVQGDVKAVRPMEARECQLVEQWDARADVLRMAVFMWDPSDRRRLFQLTMHRERTPPKPYVPMTEDIIVAPPAPEPRPMYTFDGAALLDIDRDLTEWKSCRFISLTYNQEGHGRHFRPAVIRARFACEGPAGPISGDVMCESKLFL
jgi:hypothetical protein